MYERDQTIERERGEILDLWTKMLEDGWIGV